MSDSADSVVQRLLQRMKGWVCWFCRYWLQWLLLQLVLLGPHEVQWLWRWQHSWWLLMLGDWLVTVHIVDDWGRYYWYRWWWFSCLFHFLFHCPLYSLSITPLYCDLLIYIRYCRCCCCSSVCDWSCWEGDICAKLCLRKLRSSGHSCLSLSAGLWCWTTLSNGGHTTSGAPLGSLSLSSKPV